MSEADRRMSARAVPRGTRCWCEDGDVTLYSTVGNLSVGGIFVRTFAPLPQGRETRIRFELYDGLKVVAVGLVMWRRGQTAEGLPTGMGLQFTQIHPHLVDRIRRFVEGGPNLAVQER